MTVRVKLFLFILCVSAHNMEAQYMPKFDVQGHRGARGLQPENTIPAFLTALEYGVTTLELDVVISSDKQVVVSHEPWMYSGICLQPNGSAIEMEDEKLYNLYRMTYDSIRQYDCGSKGNTRFPEQQKSKVYKPLLKEVIMAAEDYIRSYSLYEVDYNIEIKSTKETDGKYHPAPAEFSELVFSIINQYLPLNRVVIQSFDPRVLKYWKQKHPEVRLALLVENKNSIAENLNRLGFNPTIYSPDFTLLTPEKIKFLQQKRIKVIPWTVNEIADITRLKNWGVDGVITDYPNRTQQLGLGIKKNQVSGKTPKKSTRN